jgi:hypothetical protein
MGGAGDCADLPVSGTGMRLALPAASFEEQPTVSICSATAHPRQPPALSAAPLSPGQTQAAGASASPFTTTAATAGAAPTGLLPSAPTPSGGPAAQISSDLQSILLQLQSNASASASAATPPATDPAGDDGASASGAQASGAAADGTPGIHHHHHPHPQAPAGTADGADNASPTAAATGSNQPGWIARALQAYAPTAALAFGPAGPALASSALAGLTG